MWAGQGAGRARGRDVAAGFALTMLAVVLRRPHSLATHALAVALMALVVVLFLIGQRGAGRENEAQTAQLRANVAELQRSTDRCRLVLDRLAEAVLLMDADGIVIEVNARFVEMTGWAPADVVGRPGIELTAPEHRHASIAAIGHLLAGEDADRLEVRVLAADGRVLWVDVDGQNLLDDPSLEAVVVSLRDITAHRAAEDDLARAQSMFTSAFESAPIGMVMAGVDGRLFEVNAAFAHMLGYTPVELEGRVMADLLSPHDHAVQAAGLRTCLVDGGGPWSTELVFVDRSGRRVVTTTSGRQVGGPAGPMSICQVQDVTVARHTADQLAWSTSHDALTGLPNRVRFVAALDDALAGVAPDRVVGVLFVDLDRFKLVNDSLGHRAGDELLRVAARRITGAVRAGDVVARFGGDEFTILVRGPDEDAVRTVAERVQAALTEPIKLDSGDLYMTSSTGLTLSAGAGTADELIRDADAAMHRAKDRGRNRIERFDAETRTQVVSTLRTATDLHRALERGELVVHYQPVVRLDDRRITSFEALVRWHHPERGMVGPAEFIPMAEDTGLIVPVGERVLELALADLHRWQQRPGWEQLAVNVNLSPRQLAAPNVTTMFADAIARHGVDPDTLWVEITEGALMADVKLARTILAELRQLGLHLAVDDFGTGYSSLTYLTRFPVECLKIDRSFVAGLGHDQGDAAIVDAVVGLGHAMGLAVVSEGVETDAQVRDLVRMGCLLGQGYLFSRPVPAREVDALLAVARSARAVDAGV